MIYNYNGYLSLCILKTSEDDDDDAMISHCSHLITTALHFHELTNQKHMSQ